MIKNQRDILVNQERERKNNKKLRDNQKRMYTAMQLQPPLSPISPELEAAEIPSLDQMIESFQGMDFGQYDHLGEQMFFGQESQPGDRLQLSSSDTDLHFLHLSSVQVHSFSPQAHRCSQDSLWDLSSLDHTRGPRRSLPVSWGRFHLLVQDLSLGLTSVRRQFQGRRRHFLQFLHPLHFTLILEGLLLHQIRDMQGLQLHFLQLLTQLRR